MKCVLVIFVCSSAGSAGRYLDEAKAILGTQRYLDHAKAILGTQRYFSKGFLIKICSRLRRGDFRYTTILCYIAFSTVKFFAPPARRF